VSRPAERRDAGFTIVEVVVAIGIVMTVLVAALPQLVGGIRATDLARSQTQAKGLATSELERMRNLPFHVEPNAGQYVDLFDRYFHDLDAPTTAPTCLDGDQHVAPSTASTGYVAAGAARCDWEPSGPFYRTVRTATSPRTDPDLEGFVVVVAAQFLDASTPPAPVEPRAGYDTQTVGADVPASAQVGVSVTVLAERPTTRSPVTTRSQVARSYQTETRLRAAADATALEIGTTLPGTSPEEPTAVTTVGGLLHLDASLVAGSRVEAAASGISASAGTGESAGTVRTATVAPPDTAPTWSTLGEGRLTPAGCDVVCWGGGQYYGSWTPRTTDGLPGIGTSASPVQVALKTPSAGGGNALLVGAGSAPAFLPDLGLSNPVAVMRAGEFGSGVSSSCRPETGGNGLRLHSGGWATTTELPTGGADACATTHTADIGLLPNGADRSRVVVRLESAHARCTVSGAGHTPTQPEVDFTLRVSYWNGSSYTQLGPFTRTTGGQLPDPATIVVGSKPLSTWIESWTVARPGAGITTSTAAGSARADVPAVLSLLTVPLRQQRDDDGNLEVADDGTPVPEERSTLSLTVGSVSCVAEDRR